VGLEQVLADDGELDRGRRTPGEPEVEGRVSGHALCRHVVYVTEEGIDGDAVRKS
jgi:hypothetical protein